MGMPDKEEKASRLVPAALLQDMLPSNDNLADQLIGYSVIRLSLYYVKNRY